MFLLILLFVLLVLKKIFTIRSADAFSVTTPYLFFTDPLRNKECPTCRKKLVSRRSLRRDSNFDALISKIYPSRDEYEAHQRSVLERLNRLHNKEALSSSIEEGLRQQARYRSERLW